MEFGLHLVVHFYLESIFLPNFIALERPLLLLLWNTHNMLSPFLKLGTLLSPELCFLCPCWPRAAHVRSYSQQLLLAVGLCPGREFCLVILESSWGPDYPPGPFWTHHLADRPAESEKLPVSGTAPDLFSEAPVESCLPVWGTVATSMPHRFPSHFRTEWLFVPTYL